MEKITEISEIISLKKETENKILAALNEFQDSTGLYISTIGVNIIEIPSKFGQEFLTASVEAKVVF